MNGLPIVSPDDYQWVSSNRRSADWKSGHLHWVPVGKDRGNGGRIKLAGEPMNPLAERLINGMESLIEFARQCELMKNPAAMMPANPRDAVLRYFGFPRMDSIERLDDEERKATRDRVDEVRKNLSIRLDYDKKSKQFAVTIRDRGIGQVPVMMHEYHPAMISAFAMADEPEPGVLGEPCRVRSVHLTLLAPDGAGKADVKPNKLIVGSPRGLPIVLAPPNDLLGLAITEGIEDAVSVHQATGLGAWAAGSATFMPALADAVPSYVECVTIYTHGDPAGRNGARKLAEALARRGVEVFVERVGGDR